MATATSVEALLPGDHACLTLFDQDERLDLVAAFVRDGLRLDRDIELNLARLHFINAAATDRGVAR